jgi:hypothetical protein
MQSQLVVRPTGVLASPTGVLAGLDSDHSAVGVKNGVVEHAAQRDEVASSIQAWMRLASGHPPGKSYQLGVGTMLADLLRMVTGEGSRQLTQTEQERIRLADAKDNAVKMTDLFQARPRTHLERVGPGLVALEWLEGASGVIDSNLEGEIRQLDTPASTNSDSQAPEPVAIDLAGMRLVVWMVVLAVLALLLVV